MIRQSYYGLGTTQNIDRQLEEGNALVVQVASDDCFDGTVDLQGTFDGVNYNNAVYIQLHTTTQTKSVAQLTSISTATSYVILAPVTQVRIKITAACTGTVDVVLREIRANDFLANPSANSTAPIEATDAGVVQFASTTYDLGDCAGAGSFDLFTGTSQKVLLESFVFQMPNVDASDDCNLTSISVQTDDTEAGVIIDSTTGAVANLTAEAQLAWTGALVISVGSKIQLTIAGGAADATTTVSFIAKYRAISDGGTLA